VKEMLTTAEVGAWLHYSADQVRRFCEQGRFDGDGATPGAYRVCVGAHWRIPRAAVELFLAERAARVRRRNPQNLQSPQK
jgi:hypothetical protein